MIPPMSYAGLAPMPHLEWQATGVNVHRSSADVCRLLGVPPLRSTYTLDSAVALAPYKPFIESLSIPYVWHWCQDPRLEQSRVSVRDRMAAFRVYSEPDWLKALLCTGFQVLFHVNLEDRDDSLVTLTVNARYLRSPGRPPRDLEEFYREHYT